MEDHDDKDDLHFTAQDQFGNKKTASIRNIEYYRGLTKGITKSRKTQIILTQQVTLEQRRVHQNPRLIMKWKEQGTQFFTHLLICYVIAIDLHGSFCSVMENLPDC